MKGIRGLLAGAGLLLAAGQAVAGGTVYRCESADGGLSYTSKRVAGAKCKVISTYTSDPKPARAAVARPSPAAAGSVVSNNLVAGSPANVDANPPATFMGGGSPPAAASAVGVPVAGPAAIPKPAVASAMPTRRLVQGQVYSYILDGVRHYTSKAPRGVAGVSALRTIQYKFLETCFACAVDPGVNFNTLRLNTSAYAVEISAAARQNGVEEAVVRAIIHAESAFNPNALSRVGAQGLMQLMPATARRFGVGNPFDAGQNIQGGVQYLAWLLKRFNGNLELAAAGYNAGEGAVAKYGGVPPYSETQRYVQRVGVLAQRYRGTLASAK